MHICHCSQVNNYSTSKRMTKNLKAGKKKKVLNQLYYETRHKNIFTPLKPKFHLTILRKFILNCMTAAQYFNYTVYRTMDMDNEYPTKNKQKKIAWWKTPHTQKCSLFLAAPN